MTRRLIFLDWDGALNHEGTEQRLDLAGFPSDDPRHMRRGIDPACLAQLRRICDVTGAGIVFSSSWRVKSNWGGFIRNLGLNGWRRPPIVGSTPVLEGPRGNQIDQWLSDHPHEGETRFVILDDESDMAHLIDHLVQTSPRAGLTEALADAAIRMLS